jgi:hypothetical protein
MQGYRQVLGKLRTMSAGSAATLPDFLPRYTGRRHVGGFHQGKPHGHRQSHQYQQKIPDAGFP